MANQLFTALTQLQRSRAMPWVATALLCYTAYLHKCNKSAAARWHSVELANAGAANAKEQEGSGWAGKQPCLGPQSFQSPKAAAQCPEALGLSGLHQRHDERRSTIYYLLKINSFHDYSNLGKPCSMGSRESCSGLGLFLEPEVMETL